MNLTQKYVVAQLRKELEQSEETEHLIDWLLDAWDTLEILQNRFGAARATQIFTASASFPRESTREITLV